MAKSIAPKILIVIIGLGVVAGIGAIIYFFIIKNDDIREQVFVDLTTTFNSIDQNKFETNIGGINGGEYSDYSVNVTNSNYDMVCLQFLMDKQILDIYTNELIYIGNIDNDKVNNIKGFLISYKDALAKTLESQRIFNENKTELGSSTDENERAALAQTFLNMIKDFKNLNLEMRKLTAETYKYVTSNYYKNIDAFKSEKFVRTYAIERQSEVYFSAMQNLDTFKIATFNDTRQMLIRFNNAAKLHFTEQSSVTEVIEFLEIFSTGGKCNYDDVLNSYDKVEYVNNLTAELKANYIKVVTNLGILVGETV